MKFTAESAKGNVIRSYNPGELHLEDEIIRQHVIIAQDQIIKNWSPAALHEFSIADFAQALDLEPEIILLGTGQKQLFPPIAVLTELMQGGVAIEVMSTNAACRTYNVLVGENRAAIAALLID